MKFRLAVLIVLVLMLISCSSFKSNVESNGLYQSYDLCKMQVDEPVAQQNLYFVRALFSSIDVDNDVQSVQGVKVKWSYLGGDYVTTFPLNKVKWVVDSSMSVPQFKVDWDKHHLEKSPLFDDSSYLFQNGGSFNPNDILEKQKYYSQVVISLNQTDYDLVMSYIFK